MSRWPGRKGAVPSSGGGTAFKTLPDGRARKGKGKDLRFAHVLMVCCLEGITFVVEGVDHEAEVRWGWRCMQAERRGLK